MRLQKNNVFSYRIESFTRVKFLGFESAALGHMNKQWISFLYNVHLLNLFPLNLLQYTIGISERGG